MNFEDEINETRCCKDFEGTIDDATMILDFNGFAGEYKKGPIKLKPESHHSKTLSIEFYFSNGQHISIEQTYEYRHTESILNGIIHTSLFHYISFNKSNFYEIFKNLVYNFGYNSSPSRFF